MNTITKRAGLGVVLRTAAGAAALVAAAAGSAPARGETMFALVNPGRIATLDTEAPGEIQFMALVTGLEEGETLLAIDYRPITSRMYGLGSTGRLYLIDPRRGEAVAVGSAPFTVALRGSEFGFDCNPVADHVRITSDAGQNMRINLDTGTVVDHDETTDAADSDPDLHYGEGDEFEGEAPGVVASAYTTNFVWATEPMLLNLDRAHNVLVQQTPPNEGELHTVGRLTPMLTGPTGFDISGTGTAYMATRRGDTEIVSALYTLDIDSGRAMFVGDIGSFRATAVMDIAVRLCRPDFDGDEGLDVNDFIAFQAAWRAREGRADFDLDGAFSVNDFIAYQAGFRAGCD